VAPATTDRDRWLALGLLVAALALAYFVLLHPWWTVPMMDTEDRIATLQARELRVRTQLAQAPAVERRLVQVREALRGRPGFLPEATPELATAGLVKRLETVVVQASPGNRSCAITNRSPLSEQRPAERFPRVTVQVRLRCGAGELASVLHSLESGSPRVFIENLNILAQRYFYMPGQGKAQSGGLDVSFDLYGYIAPRPAGKTARASAPTQAPAPEDMQMSEPGGLNETE
jgi:general secretion pathway protein M